MNYLSVNKDTHEIFLLLGCNSEQEALQFINNTTHVLVCLNDEQLDALNPASVYFRVSG